MIERDPHPSLHSDVLSAAFSRPIGEFPSPPWLVDLLRPDAEAPVRRSEELRAAVRSVLRHGGYKPTGRGKPSSEYLARAAELGELESINVAVDLCNAVSLHSGIPISVIDLDKARPPLRIATVAEDASYVFNSSGQQIQLKGLVCLFDAKGPCANAVKDSQRTKTGPGTTRTASVLWGAKGFEEEVAGAAAWYRELLERAGADIAAG